MEWTNSQLVQCEVKQSRARPRIPGSMALYWMRVATSDTVQCYHIKQDRTPHLSPIYPAQFASHTILFSSTTSVSQSTTSPSKQQPRCQPSASQPRKTHLPDVCCDVNRKTARSSSSEHPIREPGNNAPSYPRNDEPEIGPDQFHPLPRLQLPNDTEYSAS